MLAGIRRSDRQGGFVIALGNGRNERKAAKDQSGLNNSGFFAFVASLCEFQSGGTYADGGGRSFRAAPRLQKTHWELY
jgi:hypothetical protein